MPNFGDLFGGSNIKSVQRGVITMSNSTSSTSVAITPVNPAFTELRNLGASGIAYYTSGGLDTFGTASNGVVTLTGGGTTITAECNNRADGSSTKIGWELTEYYPS